MSTSPAPAPYVEPWLRGTYTDVPAVARAVLHALDLALDDLTKWTEGLTDAEVHSQPLGLPSLAFHLRHIARSTDRILSYAEGNQLTSEQLAALKGRAKRGRISSRAPRRSRSLLQQRRRPHPRPRHRQLRHPSRSRPQAATHIHRRRAHPRSRPHPAPHRPGSHHRQSPQSTPQLKVEN